MATSASRVQAELFGYSELFHYSYSRFSVYATHPCFPSDDKVIFGDYIQTRWAPGNPSSFQSNWFSLAQGMTQIHFIGVLVCLLSFQSDLNHFLLPHGSTSAESCCHLYTTISHLPPLLHEVWLSASSWRAPFTHLHFNTMQCVSRTIYKPYIKCIKL